MVLFQIGPEQFVPGFAQTSLAGNPFPQNQVKEGQGCVVAQPFKLS